MSKRKLENNENESYKKIKLDEKTLYLKKFGEEITFVYNNDKITKEFKKKSNVINLSNKEIQIENFKQIKEGIDKKEGLIELDLSNNNFYEKEIYFLKEIILKENKKIKILDLSDNNYIGNFGVSLLLESLENNNVIEELDLSRIYSFNTSVNINFNSISKIKNLKKLNLSKNNLNLSNTIELSNSLKLNNSIKYLDLSLNNIEVDGIKYLFNSIKNNEILENLNLNFSIDDENEEEIIEIEEYFKNSNNSLIELNLSNNNICSNIIKNLSNGLKNNSKLKILNLSGNYLGKNNDVINHLLELIKNNNSIINLNIGNNEIKINNLNEIINEINNNNIVEELNINRIIFNNKNNNEEDEKLYLNSLNNLLFKNKKIRKLEIGWNRNENNYYYYLNSFKFENNEVFNNSIEELILNELFNHNGVYDFFNETIYCFNELKKIKFYNYNIHIDEKIINLIYSYLENEKSNKLNYFEIDFYNRNILEYEFDLLKLSKIIDKKYNLKEMIFNNENLYKIKNISKIENYFLNIKIDKYGIYKDKNHIDSFNSNNKFKNFKTEEYFDLNFIYKYY